VGVDGDSAVLSDAISGDSGEGGEPQDVTPAEGGDAELEDADAEVEDADAEVGFLVSAVSPSDGQADLPVDVRVSVLFSRDVEPSTLSVQAAWGPCDPSASVFVSKDDFVTCAGGALSVPEPSRVQLIPMHGLFDPERTFRVRISGGVTDVDGEPLGEDFEQTQGFGTINPPCTATEDPTAKDGTGATCVAAAYQDNGDGTITDLANKLLWTKCSLGGDGTLKNGTGFGCEEPVLPDDAILWEVAIEACDDLVLAGRDDWKVPDVSQLMSLQYGTGEPSIDTTFFPNASSHWYAASSTYNGDARLSWAVLFGYAGFSDAGYGSKIRSPGYLAQFARCVAGASEPAAPALADMRVQSSSSTALSIQYPPSFTATVPAPTKTGYIGVDGSIGIVGTTVVNALQGPIDFSTTAGQSDAYVFGGLASMTTYRVIVVAENAQGYSDTQLVVSTGAIAPYLAPLVIGGWDRDEITLQRPTFSTAGNPDPTVLAYLGPKDDIGSSGSVISGYTRGPIDVSMVNHAFTDLDSNLTYGIYVVAENTAGYSKVYAEQHIGRYFDNGDGTVYSPQGNLTWRKCSKGQSWTGVDDNGCSGNLQTVQFCWEPDNDCNGGIDTGLLSPPWLDNDVCPTCSGFSQAWEACDGTFAGRSDWRVPTKDDVLSLVDPDYDPPVNPAAFPASGTGDYWTANSTSLTTAKTFSSPNGVVNDGRLKDHAAYVRCVASGP